MPSITLKQSAIEKLLSDPKIREWLQDRTGSRVPSLRYYRRSYATARDGAITEYGDGFTLTTIDPDDPEETKGIVIKSVAVASVLDIVVGGGEEMMAMSFAIGWVNKFTFEPLTSA